MDHREPVEDRPTLEAIWRFVRGKLPSALFKEKWSEEPYANTEVPTYDASAGKFRPGTPSGTGAPTNAQYVTLATDATLSAERVLTEGTGIDIVDAGAGSTVTLSVDLSELGTGTLDQAYDFGGAGAGRTINTTDGAVLLTTTEADSEPNLSLIRAAADGERAILEIGLTGEANPRIQWEAGGQMKFGPGGATAVRAALEDGGATGTLRIGNVGSSGGGLKAANIYEDAANQRVTIADGLFVGSALGLTQDTAAISSNNLTQTQPWMKVTATGTINNIVPSGYSGSGGDILIVSPNAGGVTVTIADGAGNIECITGGNIVLSAVEQVAILFRNGSTYYAMASTAADLATHIADTTDVHAHSSLSGVTADQHHAQSHDHSAAGDGTALVPASINNTGALSLSGDITVSISAAQNNWNPTGLSTASTILVSATGALKTITGIEVPATNGRILIIHNTGAYAIPFNHDNGVASDPENRFWFPGAQNISLGVDASIILQYDELEAGSGGTAGRWKIAASPPVAVTGYGHTQTGQTIDGNAATDTQSGHVELATDAETLTGTSSTLAITPANLKNSHTDQADPHTVYVLESAHSSPSYDAGHHAAVTLGTDADVLLGLTGQQIDLDSQNSNLMFAGPASGGAADPTFRSMVMADIPAASRYYTVNFIIDGGGSAPSTGVKGTVHLPAAGTIDSWKIEADQSGDAVVDVKLASPSWTADVATPSYASIAGTEKPTLASQVEKRDTALGTWTTTVAADDQLQFVVDSATTVTRLTVSLKVLRT